MRCWKFACSCWPLHTFFLSAFWCYASVPQAGSVHGLTAAADDVHLMLFTIALSAQHQQAISAGGVQQQAAAMCKAGSKMCCCGCRPLLRFSSMLIPMMCYQFDLSRICALAEGCTVRCRT
jgi:hypothetical protein